MKTYQIRTLTVNGKAITYPDKLVFAYNPNPIVITGSEQETFSIVGTGKAYSDTRAAYNGKISIDVSRYLQMFVGKDTPSAEVVVEVAGQTLDFTVLWGAINIGEKFNTSRTLPWSIGLPFEVSFYVPGGATVESKTKSQTAWTARTLSEGLHVVDITTWGYDGSEPVYIRMLGAEGLKRATQIAILNANYLAAKLKDTYGIVYTGTTGRVGHELILECRKVKEQSGIDENDIAKRLMDFGYHAPTLSFPVHGTLMVEPTESESKAELDRFVEVLECIWNEIKEVENGYADRTDNVLKNAPHPEYEVTANEWEHSYSRSKAAFPLDWLHDSKFWINVARVDNAYGDRNLVPTIS